MPLNKLDPSKLNSWKALGSQFKNENSITIEELMEEPNRLDNFSIEWEEFILDFIKQKMNQTERNCTRCNIITSSHPFHVSFYIPAFIGF